MIDIDKLRNCQKIVVIAHNLGMDMTAVGVETAGNSLQLNHLKCRWTGIFFLKPVEAEAARTSWGTDAVLRC